MAVNIQIVGESAAEALKELATLASGIAGSKTIPVVGTVPVVPNKRRATNKDKPGEEAGDTKQGIQTGEERADPQDTTETEAQDTVDEHAETETTEKLSHDSVRAALGSYVKKFGMPAAQEDGPKLLAKALGDKPDKSTWKISDIPDDQAKLKAVLDGINEMLTKNPFKREPVKA